MGLMQCNIHDSSGVAVTSHDISDYIADPKNQANPPEAKLVEVYIYVEDHEPWVREYLLSLKFIKDNHVEDRYSIRSEEDEEQISFTELLVPICVKCLQHFKNHK